MPKKKGLFGGTPEGQSSITNGNIDRTFGDKNARIRGSNGRYKTDSIFGKKKRK